MMQERQTNCHLSLSLSLMDSSSMEKSLGASLPVPNVQELAKQTLDAMPPRYVHPDQDPQTTISTGPTFSPPTVPIIDLQKLLLEETASSELQKFHSACADWGFFQLVNHGVGTSLIEKMKREIEDLFKLTWEEKKRFAQESGDIEGYGQVFVVSEEQKLDWGDMFYLVTLPVYCRKQSLFEELPLSYRETVEIYSMQMRNLALTLLGLMARALKMDSKEIRELFEDGYQGMRTNYYPPCPQPDLAIGLSPHSDSVGLTILLQVNEVQGLEIKKDGKWVPIQPLPNALTVNIGDVLEIITNGAYQSVLHRAIVNSVQERLSMATFYSPNLKAEIGPSPSLINPEKPPLYKRITVEQCFKAYFARELKDKSIIDMMKIEQGENNHK